MNFAKKFMDYFIRNMVILLLQILSLGLCYCSKQIFK